MIRVLIWFKLRSAFRFLLFCVLLYILATVGRIFNGCPLDFLLRIKHSWYEICYRYSTIQITILPSRPQKRLNSRLFFDNAEPWVSIFFNKKSLFVLGFPKFIRCIPFVNQYHIINEWFILQTVDFHEDLGTTVCKLGKVKELSWWPHSITIPSFLLFSIQFNSIQFNSIQFNSIQYFISIISKQQFKNNNIHNRWRRCNRKAKPEKVLHHLYTSY